MLSLIRLIAALAILGGIIVVFALPLAVLVLAAWWFREHRFGSGWQ